MNEDTRPCPLCEALNDPTGELGNLVHYNCRGCGMWYNRERDADALH